MIDLETKQRIFALHIGCEVVAPDPRDEQDSRNGYLTGISGENQVEIQYIEDGNVWEEPEYQPYDEVVLHLFDVQYIQDKHLIQCYHLHSSAIAYDYTQDFSDVLTMAKHWLKNGGYQDMFKCSKTVDYLRFVYYATPYQYHTVEDLVKAGVFKLKQ